MGADTSAEEVTIFLGVLKATVRLLAGVFGVSAGIIRGVFVEAAGCAICCIHIHNYYFIKRLLKEL